MLERKNEKCSVYHYIVAVNAAAGGHLDILHWLWQRGARIDENSCAAAAANGNFEVLRWMRSEPAFRWDVRTRQQ
jgi:hypothetical protein